MRKFAWPNLYVAVIYKWTSNSHMFYRPVNLIHETKDRWVYAATFGALTGQFLSLVLNGNVLESVGYVANIWKGDCY